MHSEPLPLLSVAMGVCYRRPDLALLERSVRSILAQTYTNLEFLICQNGSSEAACRFLEALAAEDSRLQLIDGTGANTLAQKLNRCIQSARGYWVARMDDDDFSEPERLEHQMSYLLQHPECAFVGCQVRLVQEGREIEPRHLPERPDLHDFLFTQPYIHPTLVFRKEALDTVNGYCEAARCVGCEDYDLLLRLYGHGCSGVNLKHVYFSYTVPPARAGNRTFRMRCNEMRTRFVLFRRLGLLPQAFPYVVKPVLVGLLPKAVLPKLKALRHSGIQRRGVSRR